MDEVGILLIGHGSRDGRSNEGFLEFVEKYKQGCGITQVRYAFIELEEPGIEAELEILVQSVQKVIIAPLLLFKAGHANVDVPDAVNGVKAKFPNREYLIVDAFGVQDRLADLMTIRANETAILQSNDSKEVTVLVLGRGASDTSATSDFSKQVRLFEEKQRYSWVLQCFAGRASPSFPEALAFIEKLKPGKLVIIPYLFFPGILMQKLEAQLAKFCKENTWLDVEIAETLGSHDIVVELFAKEIKKLL